jgi:hypothetical protein
MFVDECGFALTHEDTDSLNRTFTQLGSLIERAKASNSDLFKWSEVWHTEGASGTTLYARLTGHSVDRDVRLRALRLLDSIPDWDHDSDFDIAALLEPVVVGGEETSFAPTLARNCASGDDFCAYLTTDQADRRGSIDISSSGGKGRVGWFLADATGLVSFWRIAIARANYAADAFESWSGEAFPALIFRENIWADLGNFKGKEHEILPTLADHLAALCDEAPIVWAEFHEPHVRSSQMAGRAGVTCSPESPNTRRNSAAMAQRQVKFGDVVVNCQWHTKLRPDKNRIHFDVDGHRVYVGIFTEHLLT